MRTNLYHGRILKSEIIVRSDMSKMTYVYWQEEDAWLGYLQEYPDYWTQGESREDLEEHLRDLYRDLTSGEIPGVRRVGELVVT